MTQQDAANIFDVSQRAISGWLGGSIPRTDKLQKIATYFRIDLEVLTDETLKLPSPYDRSEEIKYIIEKLSKQSINTLLQELEVRFPDVFVGKGKKLLKYISMLPNNIIDQLAKEAVSDKEYQIAGVLLFFLENKGRFTK